MAYNGQTSLNDELDTLREQLDDIRRQLGNASAAQLQRIERTQQAQGVELGEIKNMMGELVDDLAKVVQAVCGKGK